jgi:hypothetical protein
MNRLRKAYYVLRYLGPRVLWIRAGVYVRSVTGQTRRIFAPLAWEAIRLADVCRPGTPTDPPAYAAFKRAQGVPFLFPLGRPPEIPRELRCPPGSSPLRQRLDALAEGHCMYFFSTRSPHRTLDDWYFCPLTGGHAPREPNWCDIPDYVPPQGDLRAMWEPARAAWAIDLARGAAHGLRPDAADLYWRWLDSWLAACPPFRGMHWKCGQESSVRLIALTLGLWALGADPATTPARWEQFARLAWATGYRVRHHIGYAVSQKNNHAISEACGLMLVGHLFPELRESRAWFELGRRVLCQEIVRQTYADGAYVQQSMVYHRVMLHVGLLAARIAELAGAPLEPRVLQALADGAEFLFQMMNEADGRVPNYGPNDGSLVLPLSECPADDFRPVIQSVHFLAQRRRMLPAGPWDEDLLWLFGREALETPAPVSRRPGSSAYGPSGYYTLRGERTWAMMRCHTYRDRPGQCDPLTIDLWWRGVNLIRDCGTYLYYVPQRPDVERHFKSIAAHNTLEIGGRDPMEVVSRYLWFPWPKARARHVHRGREGAQWVEGESASYDRKPWNVLHRRLLLLLPGDVWLVVDDLLGEGAVEAVARWHLADVPIDGDPTSGVLHARTSAGTATFATACSATRVRSALVRGRDDPGRVQGFAAERYAERFPIPVIETSIAGVLPVRAVTMISAGATTGASGSPTTSAVALMPETARADTDEWILQAGDWAARVSLARPSREAGAILREVSLGPARGAEQGPRPLLTV